MTDQSQDVTKKDISEALNDYLGVEISWENLKRSDLDSLVTLFNDPIEVSKRLLKREAEDKLKTRSAEIIDKAEKVLESLPRPFGILDRLIEGKSMEDK